MTEVDRLVVRVTDSLRVRVRVGASTFVSGSSRSRLSSRERKIKN